MHLRSVSALLALVSGAVSMYDTEVLAKLTCVGYGQTWDLDFPKTTAPTMSGSNNGPQFNFTVSNPAFNTELAAPMYHAKGSLGLANHPLGIFKFNTDGPACGAQRVYIYDGVLGYIDFAFPACPWTAAPKVITGQVHVWTVIPEQAVPIAGGVSTGFEVHVDVQDSKTSQYEFCAQINLNQPANGTAAGAMKEQDTCNLDDARPWKRSYPVAPGPETSITKVTISLDDDPFHRWDAIIKPRAAQLQALINAVAGKFINPITIALINREAEKHLATMGPYGDEIRGMANASGIELGELWIMNMFYEVEGLCTSVVAQDKDGNIMHGRNLDFGLFTGVDPVNRTWTLTEMLRPLLLDVEVTKNGKTLYYAIGYAGYIGIHSGMRPGAFSATVNSRFDKKLDSSLITWILNLNFTSMREFATFKLREAIENDATYDDAMKRMSSFVPMGPAYIIMGGTQKGQGAVLSLESNHTSPVDVWSLDNELQKDSYYVLMTNYDHTKPPPQFDDRAYPGINCMDKVGQEGINYSSLWNVLSSNPTMNAATTFTMLMSAASGHWEAWQQKCLPGAGCNPF